MCIYDRSADTARDMCLTIEQFERDLAKGDELIKCGPCYGNFNLFTRLNDIDECSAVSSGVVPCGTEKDGEMKYPMCFWDASKNEPISKCDTIPTFRRDLAKRSKKSTKKGKKNDEDEDDMLLGCGFCDEMNLFEGYWEPPAPPTEIHECDWNIMDTCNDGSKKKKKNTDDYYPMCIWDGKKGEYKSKCQKPSKLNSMKKDEYLAGCGYCEDAML